MAKIAEISFSLSSPHYMSHSEDAMQDGDLLLGLTEIT